MHFNVDVSVIIPVHNGEKWIDECCTSIINQTAISKGLCLQLSVYDDASTDESHTMLNKWKNHFENKGITLILSTNNDKNPKGVGFAKNQAIKQSNGKFLCFHDVDDVMMPERIWTQYNLALHYSNSIVGSKFKRDPPGSTTRFSKWANNLPESKLNVQIYTSHGPTVIMPTWFCNRSVFERVGSFSERGKGVPEDLIFFYQHLKLGGTIQRADDVLLVYRYHKDATTFSVSSDTIWKIRINELEENFLSRCIDGFTIWNAGKEGRRLARSLSLKYRNKITCLCDVDRKKINKKYEMYCNHRRKVLQVLPIVHFTEAKSPFIVCVKMDMTGGDLENNIKLLNIREGIDYIMFN